MVKIGLTLGGGGARGFAHIPILEVFDELGIRPYCITGTSVGAVLGALYASGRSARDIVAMTDRLPGPKTNRLKESSFRGQEILKVLAMLDPHLHFRSQGLIRGEKFLRFLYEQMGVSRFEDLAIPLRVVATDFWAGDPRIFDSGDLLTAVRASMAIPYVFTPVILDGRVLVDGGLVNNVPFDLLPEECDIRIAVDILGRRSAPPDKPPSPIEAIGRAYQVMMASVTREKLRHNPVDIYLRPPLVDIEMLDFHKAREIYAQGKSIRESFKRRLLELIEEKTRSTSP